MKMRMKIAVGAIAVVASGAIGTVAMATPPSGTKPYESLPATSRTPPGAITGTLDGPAKAKNDGIELKINGDTQVATFELNYPPGSFSGWHKHPGIVIAVVRSGAVWRQVGCTATKFTAGESFTEVAPHYVWNVIDDPKVDPEPEGATAKLEITQLYSTRADATKLRIDQPAPRCPYGIHFVE